MTDIRKMRILLGDQEEELFEDDELQLFFDLAPESDLYEACALALDSLANKAASEANSVMIGDFAKTGAKNKFDSYAAQAQRFRDMNTNLPAFAVAEENLSEMNSLIIIRNYVLRTEA